MSWVQRQYIFLLLLTIGSLATFLIYFFLPTERARPIIITTRAGDGAPGPPSRSEILRFVDRTEEAGIRLPDGPRGPIESIPQVMGAGAGFCDVDGDGYLDLYLVRGGPPEVARNLLFRNNWDGTFTDVTDEAGVGDRGDGMGCVFGDIDNDGDADLYVTNRGPDTFYRNEGYLTFADRTEEAGLGDPSWGAGAAFGDVDGDGYLDLYVANYVTFIPELAVPEAGRNSARDHPVALLPHPFPAEPDRLYRNNGDGTFADVTRQAGIVDRQGRGMGVILSDLDEDGDIDIYVANDASPNLLLANQGDGTFVDVGLLAGMDDSRGATGLSAGDFDDDGRLDVFTTNWSDESNALFRNLPSPPADGFSAVFEDVAVPTRLASPSRGLVGWGTGLFDYDCDGDLDILVVNGYTAPGEGDPTRCIPQPAQVFRNVGGEFRFEEADVGADVRAPRDGRGAAFGDFDRDGDIDVVISTNRGGAVLLQNQGGSQNHWLKVTLEGTRSNRQGVGARIRVTAGGRTMMRRVSAGSSYLCTSEAAVHFGLGKAEWVDRIEVTWPGGQVQVHEGRVPADRAITIREREEP